MGYDVNLTRNPGFDGIKATVSRRTYEHIVDVPQYVLTHNTGDGVYIPVVKELAVKQYRNIVDAMKNLGSALLEIH